MAPGAKDEFPEKKQLLESLYAFLGSMGYLTINIDELVLLRCDAVRIELSRLACRPASCLFLPTWFRLRPPQGSAELAVGITLAAAVRYVRF